MIVLITATILIGTLGISSEAEAWRGRRYRRAGRHVNVRIPFPFPPLPPIPVVPVPPPPPVRPVPAMGAIDTDIAPEEAAIYVDGRYVGTADDFDGWPEYLVLEPGEYRIDAYLEGYEPLIIEVLVRPGMKIRMNQRLAPVREYRTGPGSSRRAWEGERRQRYEGEYEEYEEQEYWNPPPEMNSEPEKGERQEY